MRYLIEYDNKSTERYGADAQEAFQKIANKPVFGRGPVFLNWHLVQYDAETLGKKWAQFRADGKVITVSAQKEVKK